MTVAFDGSMSDGASGYYWTFGDGGTSTAASPTHTYAEPKRYSVELTVSEAGGAEDSITQRVKVP